MKLRLHCLFCGIVLSTLVPSISMNAWAEGHSPGPRDGTSQFLTQPDARPLPYRYAAPDGAAPVQRMGYWSDVAWHTIAIDHTAPLPGQSPRPAEQPGPTRTSRVMAIVHIAVHDAINAIARRTPGYTGSLQALPDSSLDAAIAQATRDTLVALYPRQQSRLDELLRRDLARLPPGRATLAGADVGKRAAAAILALRAHDGSDRDDPLVGTEYQVSLLPGHWRPDPVSRIRIAQGAYWGGVRPFVMASPSQFRAPPPPPLASDAYTQAFYEVKQLGGDGITTPTSRTAEQTIAGIFWSYDGTAFVGTPIRLFNQLAMQLALQRSSDPLELARVMALVNVAIADATIAVWETKYYYDFWRPVTAIREGGRGGGPTGAGDGNPNTRADPGWTPLGAQASNLIGPDFTPPFPSYVSGHAGLGSALFQLLRRLYGDSVSFTLVSDELNGITRDNDGRVRPLLPRRFTSLSQAEEETAQSRIYLGVHWRFDKTEGIRMGRRVADYVFQRGLVPPAR